MKLGWRMESFARRTLALTVVLLKLFTLCDNIHSILNVYIFMPLAVRAKHPRISVGRVRSSRPSTCARAMWMAQWLQTQEKHELRACRKLVVSVHTNRCASHLLLAFIVCLLSTFTPCCMAQQRGKPADTPVFHAIRPSTADPDLFTDVE